MSWEHYRRRQLGDVRHLLDCRGPMPNNDLARDCLEVLLCLESLRDFDDDSERCRNYLLAVVEGRAPWMDESERVGLVQSVLARPVKMRELSAVQIGRRMNVREAERRACMISLCVMPYDVWPEELAEIKRKAARERAWKRRRRKLGQQKREAYLAKFASKKPWLNLGISRATYFRRKARVSVVRTNLVSP
jgi:hypothetical protein